MAVRNVVYQKYLDKLTDFLELYLVKKAPTIPAKWQNILVKALPWVTLIFLILSLPFIFALLGLGVALFPAYATGISYTFTQVLLMVILLISLILEVMALPKLFKNQKRGWELLYYATLIGAIYNLYSSGLIGTLLGLLISLYILFQIRTHYH